MGGFDVLYIWDSLLRIAADGSRAFVGGNDVYWNLFDMVLTADILTEWSLRSYDSNLPCIQILRHARVIRIIRLGRQFRFVRVLHRMFFAFGHASKTLCWSLLLLFTTVYCASILVTQIVTDSGGGDNPDVRKHFGSMWKSVYTLYASVARG